MHARFGGGADAADLVLPHELASGALVRMRYSPSSSGECTASCSRPTARRLFLAEPSAYAESGDDDADAAPLSYATLAERARARGEVAIGVQRGDDLVLNRARAARSRSASARRTSSSCSDSASNLTWRSAPSTYTYTYVSG